MGPVIHRDWQCRCFDCTFVYQEVLIPYFGFDACMALRECELWPRCSWQCASEPRQAWMPAWTLCRWRASPSSTSRAWRRRRTSSRRWWSSCGALRSSLCSVGSCPRVRGDFPGSRRAAGLVSSLYVSPRRILVLEKLTRANQQQAASLYIDITHLRMFLERSIFINY